MSHKALGQYPGFNEHDPRYLCCCRSTHSRCGVIFLVVLGCVCLFFSTLGVIVKAAGATTTGGVSLSLIILIICVVGMILALKTENEKFLIPELIFTALSMAGEILMIIAFVVIVIWPDIGREALGDYFKKKGQSAEKQGEDPLSDSHIRAGAVFSIIGCLFSLWIIYWVFDFTRKYFYYLKDKKSAISMA